MGLSEAERYEKALEDILLYMTLSDVKSITGQKIPTSYFDNANVSTYLWEFTPKEFKDEGVIFTDATIDALAKPLDIAFVSVNNDRPEDFVLQRVKQTTPKQVRGLIKNHAPILVDHSVGFICKDLSRIETMRLIQGSFNGREWVNLNNNLAKMSVAEAQNESLLIQVAIGYQFSNEFFWNVYLGYEGYPGISIITDPTGAKEVFRLRDIPEGKKRRQALRNWVKEHSRKSRKDDGDEIQVRKHLRGADTFVWNGLKCKITPSLDAQKENEKLKKAREKRTK